MANGSTEHFSAAPGASARRLRRLRRIRDSTAEAIQNELEVRRRAVESDQTPPPEVSRARDLHREYSTSSSRERTASAARVPDSPLGVSRVVYQDSQKDKAVQTTGPSFASVVPEVRTEVRREIRVPANTYVVPANVCYHVFEHCHAFRHPGTRNRVQTLRICEYCVRHGGRDPQVHGPSLDEILRSGQIPNFDRPGIDNF